MTGIGIDRIVEYVNTNAKNYLKLLNDFEIVIEEINAQLEYKIVLTLDKPYINCSIKQLGLSKSVTYSDIQKIMGDNHCDQKEAIIKYIESIVLKG